MSSESEDDDDEDDVEDEERFDVLCNSSLFLFTTFSFLVLVPIASSPGTVVCILGDSSGICTILVGGVGCNAALILTCCLLINSLSGVSRRVCCSSIVGLSRLLCC